MPALQGTGTFAMPASTATRLTALAIGDDERSEQASGFSAQNPLKNQRFLVSNTGLNYRNQLANGVAANGPHKHNPRRLLVFCSFGSGSDAVFYSRDIFRINPLGTGVF